MNTEDDEFNRIEREASLRQAAVRATVTKREWVGLTDDERANCWSSSAKQSAINIEAKLKEKNA